MQLAALVPKVKRSKTSNLSLRGQVVGALPVIQCRVPALGTRCPLRTSCLVFSRSLPETSQAPEMDRGFWVVAFGTDTVRRNCSYCKQSVVAPDTPTLTPGLPNK